VYLTLVQCYKSIIVGFGPDCFILHWHGSYIVWRLNLDRKVNWNGDKYINHSTGKWRRSAYNLTEDEVKFVIAATENNFQAAKYLGIRPETWKKYASKYVNPATGKTLYEQHIEDRRYINHFNKPSTSIYDIIEGKRHYFGKGKLQEMLIAEGLMVEQCAICGFNERRITDYKTPLLLMWKDGDVNNNSLENMELVCHNHAFLYYNKTAPNCSNINRFRENPTWIYCRADYVKEKRENDRLKDELK